MTSRYIIPAVLALSFGLVGGAFAQSTTAPATTNSGTTMSTAPAGAATNNAVSTSPQNNPGAPAAGANSFTEGQAKARIADQGFSQVSNLQLDNQGVWRGTAMRDGKSVAVAMDYQGNVVGK